MKEREKALNTTSLSEVIMPYDSTRLHPFGMIHARFTPK